MTALAAVAARLRCPVCGAALAAGERALACPNGHRYDVARQGYVSLVGPRGAAAGDTPAMVAARVAFLGAGHFAPIAAGVRAAVRAAREVALGGEAVGAGGEAAVGEAAGRAAVAGGQAVGTGGEVAGRAAVAGGEVAGGEAAGREGGEVVVDLGAGTGYYFAAALDALPGAMGIALDTSAPALRRAARAHPRMAAVAGDIWRALPLADHVADLVLNVFAPRNGPEIRRILAPDGAVIVVTPTARHLAQLAELGTLKIEPGKRERLHATLVPLRPVASTHVEFDLALGDGDVRDLVAMGPSAHHIDARAATARTVTVSVAIETFRD